MPILIDGHNLIGQLPALSLQDANDEEKLIRLLRSYRARTGRAITVVFDPGASPGLAQVRHSGGIEVLFASHDSSADEVIARRVKRNRNPRSLLVVTSDRDLAGDVVRRGARVQSAGEFAAQLGGSAEQPPTWKDSPPSPDEVDAWLEAFSNRQPRDTS